MVMWLHTPDTVEAIGEIEQKIVDQGCQQCGHLQGKFKCRCVTSVVQRQCSSICHTILSQMYTDSLLLICLVELHTC